VIRQWTDDSRELGSCFDCTDWQVLGGNTLEETCTCTQQIILTSVCSLSYPQKVYLNNKMYVTKDIK